MSSYAVRTAKALGIAAESTPTVGDRWVFWRCPRYEWTVTKIEPGPSLLEEGVTLVTIRGAAGTERQIRLDRLRELYVPLDRLLEID